MDNQIPTELSEQIYQIWQPKLNDIWGSVNYLLTESIKQSRIIQLSTHAKGRNIEPIIKEIIDYLDSPGRIITVKEPGIKIKSTYWGEVRYSPTKEKWTPGPHNRICYQIDWRSGGQVKYPRLQTIEKLLSWPNSGTTKYQVIPLEQRMPIIDCINISRTCDMFFSVVDDLANICYSVGTPTFLIQCKIPILPNANNPTICTDVDDFIIKAKQHLGGY